MPQMHTCFFILFFFLGIHSTDIEVNFSLLMELADNFFTTGSIPADDGYQGPRLFKSNSGVLMLKSRWEE